MACKSGTKNLVKYLCEEYIDDNGYTLNIEDIRSCNYESTYPNHALRIACKHGRIDIVRYLCDEYKEYNGDKLTITVKPLYEHSKSVQEVIDASGPLTAKEVYDFGSDVLNAASFYRGKKIFHRDIKPSNILVRRSIDERDGRLRAKITDFGIAVVDGEIDSNEEVFQTAASHLPNSDFCGIKKLPVVPGS